MHQRIKDQTDIVWMWNLSWSWQQVKRTKSGFRFYLRSKNTLPYSSAAEGKMRIHFKTRFNVDWPVSIFIEGTWMMANSREQHPAAGLFFILIVTALLSGCRGGRDAWHSWLPANSLPQYLSPSLARSTPSLIEFFLVCRCHGEGIIARHVVCWHIFCCAIWDVNAMKKGRFSFQQMGIQNL